MAECEICPRHKRVAEFLDAGRVSLVAAAREQDGEPGHHELLLAIAATDDAREALVAAHADHLHAEAERRGLTSPLVGLFLDLFSASPDRRVDL